MVGLMLFSSVASAQKLPVYETTGTIALTLDGKQSTFHTTSNTVPGEPGRLVHTARWKVFPPMMMGGINMAPPGVFVSMSARPTVEPAHELPELKITFSVDPANYTLLELAPIEVIYTVQDGPLAGKYQYAAGSLNIESVTQVGPDVLKIVGSAAGTLARGRGGKKNAGPTLNYEATFTVHAHHQ